jgi:hypothetical protein
MCLWVCLGISLALSTHALHLTAHGSAIESVRVEVFDLGGQKIFDSGPVPGATYKWYLQRDDGRPVANGVYLYIFVTRTADGREARSSVGKITVRR